MSHSLRRALGCALVTCLFFLSLATTSSRPAFAAGGETGNVNGTVLDEAGHPVGGVTVGLASPLGFYKTKTDAAGHFNFLGVTSDTYTISLDAQGFAPLSQTGITVFGGDTVDLGTVHLAHELRTIARVAVRSPSSAFTPNQTIPQFTVTGQQLLAAQGKQANSDITSALLAAPGFQLDSSGNLILQGSTTGQVRYQMDGVDFTQPASETGLNGGFINGARALQVVPGAGDPSQGNAGAGVVNILIKRGTYPGSGLLDYEADTNPRSNQLNFSYGLASPDGHISDYFSFFGQRYAYNYGPFFSTPFDNNALYGTSASGGATSRDLQDFVNNFVFKFGKNQSQSLQFLYDNHYDRELGDDAGLSLYYPSNAPDLLPAFQGITGLTVPQLQSVIGFEGGQTSVDQTIGLPIVEDTQSSLLKFEYDNAINSTTNLAVRFFHTNSYESYFPSGPTLQGLGQITGVSESIGGPRTGGNFELDKQLGSKNLVTVSGSYDFDRPTFGIVAPFMGLENIGPDAIDFLRPANPNQPISASNPCPVTGGCYLQQFFYQQGGTPRIPPMDLDSKQLLNRYGLGLRDQLQVNDRLRLDLGLHYDREDQGFGNNLNYQDENIQPVPGAPFDPYISNWAFIEQPHYLEPRAGISFRLDSRDALSLTYGRSIIQNGTGASPNSSEAFQQFANIPLNPNFIPTGNPFTGVTPVGNNNCFPYVPYPVGAGPKTAPSYSGTVGTNLQLGRTCANYADLLYSVNDAFFPEIVTVHPGVFDNFDFSFSHAFRNGSALKFEPYFRQGYGVETVSAPLIFNPQTGVYQQGSLVDESDGRSTTSGINVQYTLPDHPYGFGGFVSLSYVNEFTTTPPASDNPYSQDGTPIVLPQSLAAGNLYRAGFISPMTARLGISYKTKSGWRVNPVLNVNSGYPYGSGLLTPILLNGVAQNVPNTNVSDQYGAGGAPQYVDPAYPGSVLKPNVAASRGTPETASGGGELSRPQVTGDVTIEYSPPKTRATFGVQILDLFNNEYYGVPTVNNNFYPVVTGIGGPLTGLNQQAVAYPGLYPSVNKTWNPYAPYYIPTLPSYGAIGLPTTFRLYVQYAL